MHILRYSICRKNPTRRLCTICSELLRKIKTIRNLLIIYLHNCTDIPSKLREVFLSGSEYFDWIIIVQLSIY